MSRHAARPRLAVVVDNSRRIDRSPAQKVLRQGDTFFPGHSRYVAPEFPGHAVCLPFVHGLPVNGLSRPLGQPSGHHSSVAQRFDKVSMILHGYRIVREFLGFVNRDISDHPIGIRTDTESMPNKDAIEAGGRLVLLRSALGYGVRRDYAKHLGERTSVAWEVWEDRLEQYEPGGTMLPVSFARLLNKLHGTTYEWLFDDDDARLPNDLFTALKNYQKKVG